MAFTFRHPYEFAPGFTRPVAYFCMEYAVAQPLKTYAGGLGYLAGSHLMSAFDLRQNMVAIGVLWKYGYYEQVRKADQTMDILFEEKVYGFLEDTGIRFSIQVSGHDVWVRAWYLPPELFCTAPLFLLSTDLPENDYLSRTISHKLYDFNPETRIAGDILLGAGGARLLECLGWEPEVYHLNESHALPLAFYMYQRCRDLGELKKRLVFTNHTPEEGGNPRTGISLLERMGFFCGVPMSEVRSVAAVAGEQLDHTKTALRMAGRANGVSRLHVGTMKRLWALEPEACPVISITNAQSYRYWADKAMYRALEEKDDGALLARKAVCKQRLFEVIADQNGEIYDPRVLTIVFAKRFTGFKRAELLLTDMDRYHRLVTNKDRPVQLVWAGKPYPMDYAAVGVFDRLVHVCREYSNCSVLVGYELRLSKQMKGGADVWLNTPRLTHEASGTSGMSAAMNGAVNASTADGWFPEFARDRVNSFVIPSGDPKLPEHELDGKDAASLYDLLEKEIIPMYYDYPSRWLSIVKNGMSDILPAFDSNRLAGEYYRLLYFG